MCVEVPPEADGERLDRVLVRCFPRWSRTTHQRWVEEGRVQIDGREATRRSRPRAGQRLVLSPAPPPTSEAVPQDIPLRIVYEDEHLLVVDKAAGMVVHPAPGHPDGTLVNALLHRGLGRLGGDPIRPGIVHRLDKDTSGLLVVARSERARKILVERFHHHEVHRLYLALAVGHPPEQVTWRTLHGRHPRDRKRFSSRVARGKEAVTHLRVLRRLHGASLVACRLETGRTHQIRVHMSDHGHPLLGDPLYGRRPRDPRLREAARRLGRQALHAAELALDHPVTQQPLRFQAPLPSDMQEAIARLEPSAPPEH